MPDFVPPGGAAPDPSQQQAPGPTADASAQAQSAQDPNNPSQQLAPMDATGDGGAAPRGTVKDANDAAIANDPAVPVDATPEEQAEYEQFVSRFLLFISDRHQKTKEGSPHDLVVKMLNDPKQPAAVTIGKTTATVAFMIVQQAMHQGINYNPEVLFGANGECCAAMLLLGKSLRLFKGLEPLQKHSPDEEYPYDQKDIRVLADAQIQASRFFGNLMIKGGMLGADVQKANEQFWHQQVQREIKTGQVPDQVIGMLQHSGAIKNLAGPTAGMIQGQQGVGGQLQAGPDQGQQPPPDQGQAQPQPGAPPPQLTPPGAQ